MRILVVEDQPDLCEVIAETMREDTYVVDTAMDGEEALYKALNWDYDLILLDVMLPKRDGWEVLKMLRAQKTTPVIMLTALSQVDDRVKGLDYGADDYLPKPFDLQELSARVKAVLRRRVHAGSQSISLGDITVHTSRQQITRSGQLVDLTAREYAMAELMISRRGAVISRDYLYEHLFDETDDSMSNVIDVFVYKLRQKLGKDFIQTRRGQGYFVEDL